MKTYYIDISIRERGNYKSKTIYGYGLALGQSGIASYLRFAADAINSGRKLQKLFDDMTGGVPKPWPLEPYYHYSPDWVWTHDPDDIPPKLKKRRK